MLVSSPRPKHSVTGFPDKVGDVCYKVLQCPDALRHAKTWNSGQSQYTRYINKISTLWIIYHQKGLDEEILKQQTKLCNLYSILRYKQNTTKMSKMFYHNSNRTALDENGHCVAVIENLIRDTERALVLFACYRRMVIPNAGILTLAELYARDIDVVIGDLVSCMCEGDVWFVPHEIVEVCLWY